MIELRQLFAKIRNRTLIVTDSELLLEDFDRALREKIADVQQVL